MPVALLLGVATASFVIWRRHVRRQKGNFVSQPSMDPSDSRDGISLQMADARLLESKALNGSLLLSTGDSFTDISAAEDRSRISSAVAADTPPAWIDMVPFSDWEIDVADVVIGLRADGRKWELGAGAFSRVSFLASDVKIHASKHSVA